MVDSSGPHLQNCDISDYRRYTGPLGPAPRCCLMRVEFCSIFVFLCMKAGGGCRHRVICPVLTRCLKWLLCFFYAVWLFLTCYFGMVLLSGLHITNTNIPRLFIFIKNKAVLYIRTRFVFYSMCRVSNSWTPSVSQCWKIRNRFVIKWHFFIHAAHPTAIPLLLPLAGPSSLRFSH